MRGSLLIWLDKEMRWYGGANGKRGRRPKFSDAAIQFCLTIKCLFNLALRQAIGMAQSLLKLARLDWSAGFQHRQPAAETAELSLLRSRDLVRITGIKEKVKVHETNFILTVRGVELCSNAVVQEPILEWYAHRAALVADIAGMRGGGALKEKQYEQATYAQTQLGGIIPPIGTDLQRRLNQLKQTA